MKKNKERRTYTLNQIYFYLTEGCNLKCCHCWIAPKYQSSDKPFPSLDPDLFHSIVRQAKPLGLLGVTLTGGEPLLHPRIRDLLEVVRSEELRLTVETNGTLCTPELAQKIKETSKNTCVSVSIDGADAETHEWVRGVDGCFEATLEGVRNLVNAGLRPQIIMSVMQRNKVQMEPVVRLAERLGAGSVKFNVVQPTARGEKMHEALATPTIVELVELGRWVENTLLKSTNLRLIYGHPMAFRPLGRIFGNNGDGCGVCRITNILGVINDGSYAMCGIGETVSDLIYGHAARDSLEDVWNNAPIIKELREGMPKKLVGVCEKCLMKSRCLGGCIAQNYHTGKNLWAPFWYCEEAKKAGVFPETRLLPANA